MYTKINSILLKGDAIPDDILVQLINLEIKESNELKKENDNKGCILLDFPRNVVQAQLLEKELSGLI